MDIDLKKEIVTKCPNCLELDSDTNRFLSKDDYQCNGCNEIFHKDKNHVGNISDGYHTFNELYHHRMVLFSIICNQNKDKAFKSKLHADGSMFDDYFIVGLNTPDGQYTYHYHIDNWDMFKVKELDKAPEWDGHQPSDIKRLLSLLQED